MDDFGDHNLPVLNNNLPSLVEIPSYELIQQSLSKLVPVNDNFPSFEEVTMDLQETIDHAVEKINDESIRQHEEDINRDKQDEIQSEQKSNKFIEKIQQSIVTRLDKIITWTKTPISDQARSLDKFLSNPLSLVDSLANVAFKPIQSLIGKGAERLKSKVTRTGISSEVEDFSREVVSSETPRFRPIDSVSPLAEGPIITETMDTSYLSSAFSGGGSTQVSDAEFEVVDSATQAEQEGFQQAQAESALVVRETFEDPEGSEFGDFLEENIGDGAESSTAEDPMKSLAIMAIAAAITAGIIVLQEPLTNILNAVAGIIEELKGPIGSVLTTVAESIKELKGPMVNLVSSIIDAITTLIDAVKEPLATIAGVVLGTIAGVLTAIQPAIISIADFIGGIIVKVLNAIDPLITEILNLLPLFTPFIRTVGNVVSAVGNIIEPLSELIEHLTGGVVKGVKKAWSATKEWFTETFIDDAIVTPDGQVIHTDPSDSIYAFKGDVAISPVRAGNSISNSSNAATSVSQVNQQFIMNTPFPAFSALAV